MTKPFTFALLAGLVLAGCSSAPEKEYDANSSVLESIPFVYRPDIQQGNIVTQEQLDRLKTGMNKQQVRFLLGTPLLADAFHQDEWGYLYSLKKNNEPREQTMLKLFFERDQLTRIEGDMQPNPNADLSNNQETVGSVPDWEPRKKGFGERILNSIGIEVQEDPVER